jgi:hypothetical protein
LVEVNQRRGSKQLYVILLQAAMAHFGICKDALQDAEGSLNLRVHPSLGALLAPLHFIDGVFALDLIEKQKRNHLNQGHHKD